MRRERGRVWGGEGVGKGREGKVGEQGLERITVRERRWRNGGRRQGKK